MEINNGFYDTLGEEWYEREDHPIALLRAENAVRVPWVASEIEKRIGKARVLDIGCGGGLLTNALRGHEVTGIDISASSVEVARRHDKSSSVRYFQGDAYALPFEDGSFDVACALDILEHVNDPEQLIREAARVVRPGGLFFFHTFNRNLLSYLLIIKGVDWFVPNAPKNMHVYPLFIKPKELHVMCNKVGFQIDALHGFAPCILSRAFWQTVFTRKIAPNFPFAFTKYPTTGYCGIAVKR